LLGATPTAVGGIRRAHWGVAPVGWI